MIRSGVCNGYSVGIFCYGQVKRGVYKEVLVGKGYGEDISVLY